MDIALNVLERLGVPFPTDPKDEDVGQALESAYGAWAGQPIPSLINLPPMTDVNIRLAMDVMASVNAAAYTVAPRLIVLMVARQIQLSLEYGAVPASCVSFVMYGGLLCGLAGDIDSGYQFGQLALDLLERLNAKQLKTQLILVHNAIVSRWKTHAHATLNAALENYQTGVENGDFESACFSLHNYTSVSFFSGISLEPLEREMAQQSIELTQLNQELILNGRENIFRQLILNLMGKSEDPCRLIGQVYDEKVQLPQLKAANDRTAVHYVYLADCILSYLFQDYENAFKNAQMAEQYLDGVLGMYPSTVFHFYNALVRLAICSKLSTEKRSEILAGASASQEKLKEWSQHAPSNFLHKYELIEAERLRVLGQDGEAREYYDLAASHASENKYINEEALAYELAGNFYLHKNRFKMAQLYLTDAVYAYRQWGAQAKAELLLEKYPWLAGVKIGEPGRVKRTESTSTSTSTEGGAEWLDLNSVIKIYQTLSSEIVLSRLLDKMIQIVIENAGAEKGCLLLEKKQRWSVEAEGRVGGGAPKILESLPVEGGEHVPESIVRYVANTREKLVLFDGAREGRFNQDNYISKNKTKSILCTPLVNQGKLLAILYLENNLFTGAFTPQRLELANLLSMQIVIMLENSLLYTHLEELVAERTAELKQANEELERMAKHDGLTGLANRRFLDERLNQEWQRLKREKGVFSVIICDIDYFKKYNDHYGHQGGDDCLVKVAHAIRGCLRRPSDLAGRYGGEEFLILLPNTDKKGAIGVAEVIRTTVCGMTIENEKSEAASHVTLSFGVASTSPHDDGSPEKLVSAADEALYMAKEQGRNRVCM